MKKFVTQALATACLVCWAASVTAETASSGGQILPKYFTSDDTAPGSLSGGGAAPGQPAGGGSGGGGNQAPVVAITGPASGTAYPVDTPVVFSGTFADDVGDTHSAQWSFEAIGAAGTVTESSGSVTGAWTFGIPGVYHVRLTVTDQAGHSGTATTVNGVDAMIVVYDRGDGFVDGRGKIDSPPGAFAADLLLTGRMDFDFDARYRKDATVPTGGTQFKFSVGDLDFQSTAYDWFVCSGARGLYRGTGTVNGAGDYAFLLSAVDGDDIGGGAVDKLRVRITNRATGAVVYDNQMGASDTAMATSAISAGDVNVRLPNGGIGPKVAPATLRPAAEPATPRLAPGFDLAQNWPNPFRARTEVRFSLPQRSHVKLGVFDLAGREVASLADGAWEAGSHAVSWTGKTASGEAARGGVYFVRMAGGPAGDGQTFASVRKMILLD